MIVPAYPDVTVNCVTKDTEFMVLACDGIWDVLTNQEVVDFVRTGIAEKRTPEMVGKHAICLLYVTLNYHNASVNLRVHCNTEM